MLFGNNLYSQTPPKRLIIGNITIKEGTVVIGGFSEVATVTSVSEVANLAQNHKNIIKKLIITGTSFSSEDLVAIKTIGGEDGALPNLVSIELKNMAALPQELFYGNNNDNTWLESFSAPEAKIIGDGAFVGCYALAEINLPNATNIGNNAFLRCRALTEINLPEAKIIGDNAFQFCDGTIEINLSKATDIGERAFNGCHSLAEINLPKATTIGNGAFLSCNDLTKLTLGETNVTVGSDAFGGNTNTRQVDLYLSEGEYNTVTGVNHDVWESKVWKSITKIVK